MKKILTVLMFMLAGSLYALPPTPTPTYGPIHGMAYIVSGSKIYIRFQSNVSGWGWIEYGAKNQGCTMVKASMKPKTEGTNFQLYIPLTPVTDFGSYYVNYGVAANASPTPTYIWTKSCNMVWYGNTGTPTCTPTFTGWCAGVSFTCTHSETPTETFTHTYTFTETTTYTHTFTKTHTVTLTPTHTFTPTHTHTCGLNSTATVVPNGSCNSMIMNVPFNAVSFIVMFGHDAAVTDGCQGPFASNTAITVTNVNHANNYDCNGTFFWGLSDAIACGPEGACTIGSWNVPLCTCTPTNTPCIKVTPITSWTPEANQITCPGCGTGPITLLGPQL